MYLDEIPRDTIALHGTSIESIEELFRTGKFPSGREDEPEIKGWLFFVPYNMSRFKDVKGLKIDPKIKKLDEWGRREFVKQDVAEKGYARRTAILCYLEKVFGQFVADLDVVYSDAPWRTADLTLQEKVALVQRLVKAIQMEMTKKEAAENLLHIMEKYGLELPESLKLRDIINHCFKLRGVVLIPNEKIFELGPKPGLDDPTTVMFHCPKGLDKKYIRGFVPLGEIEKERLKKYM